MTDKERESLERSGLFSSTSAFDQEAKRRQRNEQLQLPIGHIEQLTDEPARPAVNFGVISKEVAAAQAKAAQRRKDLVRLPELLRQARLAIVDQDIDDLDLMLEEAQEIMERLDA